LLTVISARGDEVITDYLSLLLSALVVFQHVPRSLS
jgi:hypothetical protein